MTLQVCQDSEMTSIQKYEQMLPFLYACIVVSSVHGVLCLAVYFVALILPLLSLRRTFTLRVCKVYIDQLAYNVLVSLTLLG